MCRAVVYHCETPVAESWRPSNPLPQAGRRDRGEPSADGASSVSRLSSTSKEEVERALEVGLALAPITDARRRLRLWRGPAGRVLGRNRCNLSPSIPSVSTSVVEPALSSCPRSFSFTHSRGVVGLHPAPPSTQQQIQTPKIPTRHGPPAALCLRFKKSKI